MNGDRISQLERMADQWDRCAANAGSPTYLKPDPGLHYRGYADACRKEAERLKTPSTELGVSD